MSVTLTLALPDLRPDTIRAAFDALLPPPEPVAPAEAPPGLVEFTPSGEPVFLPDGDETAAPAQPEPALLRATRAAIAKGVADGIETSVSASWQGLPRINVSSHHFRRICGGLTATVAYGGWTVIRDGIEWVAFLGGDATGNMLVPHPEADVPDDAPPAADDGVF